MANGLISAGVYGGPQDTIVEDPESRTIQQPDQRGTIPIADDTPSIDQPYVPSSADVAPPQRDLAAENNWMKRLQDYAAQKYSDPNEREEFIEGAARYTRNNIAMQRNANREILLRDKDALNHVLFDTQKFQGRGPRNDEEATQVNPGWGAMSQMALDHDKSVQKYIDTAFKHNSNVDPPPTTDRKARYDQATALIDRALRGYAGVDRYEVLSKVNPAAMDLPKIWTQDLHSKLTDLRRQRNIDNTMNTYIGWAQPMLNRAHILATDDDKMLQFEGALSRELKNLQGTSKDPEAPLTREQVYQTTSELLRKEQYGRGPFGGSTVFEFEVPKGYMTPERISKFQKAFGHLPSPQEIYQAYSTHKAMVRSGEQPPDEKVDPRYVIESYRTEQK
jgi:hypothetical protein